MKELNSVELRGAAGRVQIARGAKLQSSAINSFLNSPLGIAIFLVALWWLSCFLIALMSGWFKLSRHFKKESEPYGDIRTAGPFFYVVYMRLWGHYSSVIRLTAASDALYVSVLFPFRAGHPPLRIP